MAPFDWLIRRDPAQAAQDQTPAARTDLRTAKSLTAPDRTAFSHAHDVPEGDFRFIALDVETACGDVASICQIGLACVSSDNRIQTFSMLVDPCTRFDAFNIRLHGIGPETVAGAPRFSEALNTLLPLLSKHHLIQHSAFDKRAIAAACESSGLPTPDLRWSDSVAIARRAWPELRGNGGHGLANLKKLLNLDFHHHDAGEDARAAAMVVLQAEAHLAQPFRELIIPPPKPRFPTNPVRVANPDGPLSGAIAVFTGNLGLSREDAADLAARAGMAVKAGVTKQTTHLIVGEQDLGLGAGQAKSAKQRKAEELRAAGHPIRILGEAEFRRLVAES